ncbi:MAG: beta strand repeat-containing protein [Roseiarcus sp.]
MTTISSWKTAVSGTFGTPGDWSLGAVPTITTGIALTVAGTPYVVTSSKNNAVLSAAIASNATLDIALDQFTIAGNLANEGVIEVGPGGTLALEAGGYDNSGAITVNGGASAAATAMIDITGSMVLSSGGTVTLADSAFSEIVGGTSSNKVEFSNDANTISGAGLIGDVNMFFFNNKSGVVDADDSLRLRIVGAVGTIAAGTQSDDNAGTIETTGAGGLSIDTDMNNNGLLLADGAGALTIGVGSLANSPTLDGIGDIKALISGAAIDLDDATIESGGIISDVAGSTIRSVAGTTNLLQSGKIVNAGLLMVGAGSTLTLNAAVENTGEIELGGTTTATQLLVGASGSLLLDAGRVVLTNSAENFIGSAASAATSGAQLTNSTNIITGSGTIGDANLRLVNLTGAVIDSTGSVGMTLVGNTNSKLSSDYNDGLIENTGSGGLTIENVWSDAGMIKEAGTGNLTLLNFSNTGGGGYISEDALVGDLNLTNASLASSFLTSVAGSTINITSGSTSTIDEAIFTHGSVDVDSSTLIADNDYYNYGAINLEGSGTASVLELNGTLQLRGGGDLNLENTAGNSIKTNGSAQTFENINDTISGFGTIGDANMFFKNSLDGTVDANTANLLTINAGGGGTTGLFNAGMLESTDTGGLTIDGVLTGLFSSLNFGGRGGFPRAKMSESISDNPNRRLSDGVVAVGGFALDPGPSPRRRQALRSCRRAAVHDPWHGRRSQFLPANA